MRCVVGCGAAGIRTEAVKRRSIFELDNSGSQNVVRDHLRQRSFDIHE